MTLGDQLSLFDIQMEETAISFSTRVLSREEFLPRYIVVRPEYVRGRKQSFLADELLNGAGPFKRNIRPWGKVSDVVFFNLTAPQCANAGVGTNDECVVTITSKE